MHRSFDCIFGRKPYTFLCMAYRRMAVLYVYTRLHYSNVMQCQAQDHSASLDSYIQPIRFRMYICSTRTRMPQLPARQLPQHHEKRTEQDRTGQSQTLGSPATINHARQGIKHENKKQTPNTNPGAQQKSTRERETKKSRKAKPPQQKKTGEK